MSKCPASWRCSRRSLTRGGSGADGSRWCSCWGRGRLRAGRAKNFREIGDRAADLPQDLLAALGGTRHPLRRRIAAPSGKRIPTLRPARR
jgi:hypothetical protein